ncbi:uncharacterized protein LOC106670039 isoform X1 [Cimex lectularius]|uniref:Uncharacterized protein n=1 Tax=Cimex lectularius TaxID=79782 RepID=A0A8I6S275_CIMLE|nr:uncharacterized protein LOC106670039 isoform X1 [Cimex lectularius]
MDPWFEDAMDLLSSRVSNRSLAFTRASSVFDNEFSRMGNRKTRARIHTKADQNITENKVSEYEELKKKLRSCQDEVFKLQAANADLTQVNKRWHRYNTDMQIFIDKLQSTIRDQQEQINNIGEGSFFSDKKVIQPDEDNTPCQRIDCKNLTEEVERLKGEVEHLQFQVRSHKDDWEAEKNEKQEAVKERDALQQRLNNVLRDLCVNTRGSESENKKSCCQRCRNCENHVENQPPRLQAYESGHHHKQILSGLFLGDDNIQCDDGYSKASKAFNPEDEARSLERYGLEDTACALRPKEESYSLTSTLPLISPPEVSPCSSNGSMHSEHRTFSMGIKSGGNLVTSYFQLPVVKSSSAPDRHSAFKKAPFVNSISLSVLPPPGKGKSKREVQNDRVESQTDDDFVCPHCSAVFQHDKHLKFLDHFENCQSK